MSQDAFNIIIVLCSYGFLFVIIICCFIMPLMAAIRALFIRPKETKFTFFRTDGSGDLSWTSTPPGPEAGGDTKLDESIEQLENGQGKPRKLIK